MAKAYAKCNCATCGKTFEVTAIKRNCREAESWEKWAATYFDECDDCYKSRIAEERDAENREAAETASASGWATLEGTAKQVAWAETLRVEAVAYCEQQLSGMVEALSHMREDESVSAEKIKFAEDSIALAERIVVYVKSMTSAKWFIDNRNFGLREYRRIVSGIRSGEINA